MGCKCRKNTREIRIGKCDVCTLVFKDESVKQVQYCNICRAWLCEKCERLWWARFRAAVMRHVRSGSVSEKGEQD